MLVLAVVIAGHSAGSDVSVCPDGGVAQGSEMHRLCAATDLRFLNFDKVSHYGLFFHTRVHSQVGERSYRAIIGNLRIDNHTMSLIVTRLPRCESVMREPCWILHPSADYRLTFDVHTRMNYRNRGQSGLHY